MNVPYVWKIIKGEYFAVNENIKWKNEYPLIEIHHIYLKAWDDKRQADYNENIQKCPIRKA
jgi:hypothetical protein